MGQDVRNVATLGQDVSNVPTQVRTHRTHGTQVRTHRTHGTQNILRLRQDATPADQTQDPFLVKKGDRIPSEGDSLYVGRS